MAGQLEGAGVGSGRGPKALPPGLPAELSVEEQLAALRAEMHELLELVRSLVSLLLPKGSDDGPKLEDLIAALVAQQRDILIAVRQIQADQLELLERSGAARASNGSARG